MTKDNETPALPETKEGQLALLKRLLDTARGGKLDEATVRTELTHHFGERAREAATVEPARPKSADLPTPIELTPEVLAECLAGLEGDYKRGIVVVDETKGVNDFKAALSKDKTAGTPWGTIKEKLEADDGKFLKKAAQLQGKGTLIGMYPDGELCIKDRGNEPVIYANLHGQNIEITTDTPNRAELMQRITEEGQFADYWKIRSAVLGKGLELPPDSPNYEKKGVVAAAEAVTGEDFVRSADGKQWRSAILECGDVSRSLLVRVVTFDPYTWDARVRNDYPWSRTDRRGAVRVLKG